MSVEIIEIKVVFGIKYSIECIVEDGGRYALIVHDTFEKCVAVPMDTVNSIMETRIAALKSVRPGVQLTGVVYECSTDTALEIKTFR